MGLKIKPDSRGTRPAISCPLWHLSASRQEMAGTRPAMTWV